MVGLVGLDVQGRVWYGELSGAPSPARYSIKWTKIEERPWRRGGQERSIASQSMPTVGVLDYVDRSVPEE